MGRTKDIRKAVEAELSFDPRVDRTDIIVKSVNGEVALTGTVPSYPQYLEAAAAAQRVAGVRHVHNHLEVVLPPGDYRDDAMLTTTANNALALNVRTLRHRLRRRLGTGSGRRRGGEQGSGHPAERKQVTTHAPALPRRRVRLRPAARAGLSGRGRWW